MKIVGLTGGIGSGKTTVSRMFEALGVPVYNSDKRAKELMVTSKKLRVQIIDLLGEEAYKNGQLQRNFIAERVFALPELLQKLNALVHPAVKEDFKQWASQQDFPYVIQEAAILIENGSHEAFDKMILVTAPLEERIARILKRDSSSREAILERMQHQWEDSKKAQFADFVIENLELTKTQEKVAAIHAELLEL
ncbi:dephospho-CoA kinase [Lentiprolixibacter aurantiacus]|uniref:Dephospho-CoA kinase n=1 Tax=Lentiprolixibacter aurantiacus TaxID=2993939 RepID=A0AAE3SNP0_9FLAO|nr:dephospho-CoA kinase [Lentiprolixibacter aurantiacus]MCX2719386.1 dephospho-CoA kinase [Lentiprolixibacter aurantiacus]